MAVVSAKRGGMPKDMDLTWACCKGDGPCQLIPLQDAFWAVFDAARAVQV